MQPTLPPLGPKPTPLDHPIMPPPMKSTSAQEYDKSMEFTKSAFKVAKFPFFIRGVQAWKNSMHPGSGYPMDYLLGKVIGTALIIGSPAGIAVNAGAALVTAGGAAYAGAAKAVNAIEQKFTPDQYRKYLTGQFVDSVFESLVGLGMNAEQKNFYRDNPPEVLLGAEAIAIAFLSRYTYGNRLSLNENRAIEDTNFESSITKEYFLDICAIKNAIYALSYSLDATHAWNNFQAEAELMNAGDPESMSDAHRVEQFVKITTSTNAFVNKTKKDEVFIEMWQAKFVTV